MVILGCLTDPYRRNILYGRALKHEVKDLPLKEIYSYLDKCEDMVEELYNGEFTDRVNAAVELYLIKYTGEVCRIRRNIYIRKDENGRTYVPRIRGKDINRINAGRVPILFATSVKFEGKNCEYSSYDVFTDYDEYKRSELYSGILFGIHDRKVIMDKSDAYEYKPVLTGRCSTFLKRKKRIEYTEV